MSHRVGMLDIAEAASRETVPAVKLPDGRETRKGAATRDRIMEIAQTAVLAKGFAATSIEEVIAEAGITKSGFFYHFRDKNELAREMLRRYVAENDQIFDDIFGRARELNDDPLQAFLLGLKFLSELVRDLPAGHPGCLVAAVCYQERLFDQEVLALNTASITSWNARFLRYIEEIAAVYPPREPVDMRDVANMVSCIIDGGIIMSKALKDARHLERQVLVYRSYIKLLFSR